MLHKFNDKMKKLIVLVTSLFLLQSCDDGDLILETFNFNNETVQKCNNLLFVTKEKEILILNIPSSNFLEEPTVEGSPRIYTLTNSDELIYRLYNENVNSTAICSEIPPVSPIALEEYKALPGGQIQIITTVLPSVDETTKTTTINYIHQIKLINVQFTNGEKNLIYEEFLFGNYKSKTNTLSFNFSSNNGVQCNSNNLYKNSNTQLIFFDFPNNTLPTSAGTTLINLDSTNKITYKMFSGGTLTNVLICSATPPDSPFILEEEWIATNGTVEITTTEITGSNNLPALKYEIKFLNITYEKDNLNFTHDTFDFGSFVTN